MLPVDGAADDLLFPVIVEIGQQRCACSPHRGMDVAVDPRRCHGASSDIFVGDIGRGRKCDADGAQAQGFKRGAALPEWRIGANLQVAATNF